MRQKVRQKSKHLGFTLIDMMVATAVVVAISLLVTANFKIGRYKDDLRNGGLLVVSVLHQAQAYTLAGRQATDEWGGTHSPNGYGVFIEAQNNYIILFANTNKSELFEDGDDVIVERYGMDDYNIFLDKERVCLNFGSGCEPGTKTMQILYTMPLGTRILEGRLYTPNYGNFSFIIRRADYSGYGMKLSGDAVTGQVILGPIEHM